MNKKTLLALVIAGILLSPAVILAANTPLRFAPPYISGVPGFAGASQDPITYGTSIQVYLVRIYQFAIGISGITAVGMIVWGAINMSIYTGRIDRYEEGKTIIYQALFGLALLFGSYLLLQTINPQIVQLKEPTGGGNQLDKIATTTITGTTTGATNTICGGGQLAVIPQYPALAPTTPSANGCEFRRLQLTNGLTFSRASNDSMYDQDINLKAGAIVWLWPYYLGSNPSTAQCVVYAYKDVPMDVINYDQAGNVQGGSNTVSQSTQLVSLKLDSINKCQNDPSTQQPGATCTDCGLTGGSVDVSGINTSNLDSNASCLPSPNTAPSGIIADIKSGKLPYICYPGCNSTSAPCTRSGATLSANTITTIINLQNSGMSFTITSLTGGSHSAVGDPHYQGRAFDVVFNPQDAATWNKALKLLQSMSTVSQAACEFIGGSPPNFDQSSCNGLFATGTTNRHIHVTTQ